MRCSRGATVIELLVVIGIFGLVIALLLPAIHGARQAARRVHCQNSMRQISLALLIYHHENQAFPSGYISDVAAGGRDLGPGWGWGSAILPWLEQTMLDRTLQRERMIGDPSNLTGRTVRLYSFICPNGEVPEGGYSIVPTNPGLPVYAISAGNYVGSYGTGDPNAIPGRDAGDGVFFRNSRVNLDDLSDGASSTILIGERASRTSVSTWLGAVEGAVGSHPLGPAIVLGSTGNDSGPNAIPPQPFSYSSGHPDGANFAFGDGGVRFLANTISTPVYRGLATRRGGEISSLDDF